MICCFSHTSLQKQPIFNVFEKVKIALELDVNIEENIPQDDEAWTSLKKRFEDLDKTYGFDAKLEEVFTQDDKELPSIKKQIEDLVKFKQKIVAWATGAGLGSGTLVNLLMELIK